MTPEEALLAHVWARWPGRAHNWVPGGGNERLGTPAYGVLTVIEPCESCGEPVVLLQPEGAVRPVWFQLGGLAAVEGGTRLRFEGHGRQRCAYRRLTRNLHGE